MCHDCVYMLRQTSLHVISNTFLHAEVNEIVRGCKCIQVIPLHHVDIQSVGCMLQIYRFTTETPFSRCSNKLSMYLLDGTMHHVVCILCCTDHNQYHETFSCNKDSLCVLSSACSALNFRLINPRHTCVSGVTALGL